MSLPAHCVFSGGHAAGNPKLSLRVCACCILEKWDRDYRYFICCCYFCSHWLYSCYFYGCYLFCDGRCSSGKHLLWQLRARAATCPSDSITPPIQPGRTTTMRCAWRIANAEVTLSVSCCAVLSTSSGPLRLGGQQVATRRGMHSPSPSGEHGKPRCLSY